MPDHPKWKDTERQEAALIDAALEWARAHTEQTVELARIAPPSGAGSTQEGEPGEAPEEAALRLRRFGTASVVQSRLLLAMEVCALELFARRRIGEDMRAKAVGLGIPLGPNLELQGGDQGEDRPQDWLARAASEPSAPDLMMQAALAAGVGADLVEVREAIQEKLGVTPWLDECPHGVPLDDGDCEVCEGLARLRSIYVEALRAPGREQGQAEAERVLRDTPDTAEFEAALGQWLYNEFDPDQDLMPDECDAQYGPHPPWEVLGDGDRTHWVRSAEKLLEFLDAQAPQVGSEPGQEPLQEIPHHEGCDPQPPGEVASGPSAPGAEDDCWSQDGDGRCDYENQDGHRCCHDLGHAGPHMARHPSDED
jgi:hypothetical protein